MGMVEVREGVGWGKRVDLVYSPNDHLTSQQLGAPSTVPYGWKGPIQFGHLLLLSQEDDGLEAKQPGFVAHISIGAVVIAAGSCHNTRPSSQVLLCNSGETLIRKFTL